MSKNKIDDTLLVSLRAKGYTITDIASMMKVNKSNVSRRLDSLKQGGINPLPVPRIPFTGGGEENVFDLSFVTEIKRMIIKISTIFDEMREIVSSNSEKNERQTLLEKCVSNLTNEDGRALDLVQKSDKDLLERMNRELFALREEGCIKRQRIILEATRVMDTAFREFGKVPGVMKAYEAMSMVIRIIHMELEKIDSGAHKELSNRLHWFGKILDEEEIEIRVLDSRGGNLLFWISKGGGYGRAAH
ncbi:MAG TPA: hypothetical protein VLY03_05215 [Bacteroidota bacterium]|nr:hypothetical protein [Bacteroidota bacterium]